MQNWEVRQEVARLRVEEKRPVTELAKQYNVSPSSVTRWAKSYKDIMELRQVTDAQDVRKLLKKNEALNEEVERLTKEIEALRTAMLILAREQ